MGEVIAPVVVLMHSKIEPHTLENERFKKKKRWENNKETER